MIEIQAPAQIPLTGPPRIFLSGSIEMGTAERWQARLVRLLADESVIILNPRRDDWDATWEQTKTHPQFREQVEWELTAMEQANWILMYFSPTTTAPITLLELGLFARTGKMIICCPDGYFRKGNVEIVCERYGVLLMETLEQMVDWIRQYGLFQPPLPAHQSPTVAAPIDPELE